VSGLQFSLNGELIDTDEYMKRTGTGYFRAIHEINEIVNKEAAMTAAYDPGPIPPSLVRPPKAGKPLVYSYTLLNNYANVCPHQTWRRYVKKDQPFVETEAMKWGNAVHTALEYRLGGKPLPPNMQQWEPIVAAFDGRGATAEQKLGITREGKPCGWFDDGVFFRGKIDVTLINGATAYINDWKTGSSGYESPFELETNALLLHCKFPHLTKIVGSYAWLKENRLGTMFELSDTNGTWQKVTKLVAEFERLLPGGGEVFEKRKSGLCGHCSVEDCENHFVARPK
jgi:hypothetical protein